MHTDTLSISLRVQMHLNLKLSRVALESYQWTLPLLENESHCRIIAFIAVFSSPKMSNSPEFYLLKKKSVHVLKIRRFQELFFNNGHCVKSEGYR